MFAPRKRDETLESNVHFTEKRGADQQPFRSGNDAHSLNYLV
jgi:hypothetical protein